MDVRLSGEKDGVDAANEIYKTRVIPIVYVTASRERTTSVRIRQDLPAEVLTKPVLACHIKAALEKYCPLPGRDPGCPQPSEGSPHNVNKDLARLAPRPSIRWSSKKRREGRE